MVGLPYVSGMEPARRAETKPVLQRIRATYKRVRGFNEFGHVS
jgi:hypothetical protein